MPIISGGIDLSLGSTISLVNVIIVWLCAHGIPVFEAVMIGAGVGIITGLFNGVLIGVLRINPLLATFSSASVFAGLALWIQANPGGTIPGALNTWYNTNVFGFLPMTVLLILVPLGLFLILNATPFGTKLYALGKNENKAYASAINVTAMKICIYTFSGFAAGIAGVAMSASISAGDPNCGAALSLSAIAAAVIGGISLDGGKGDVLGTTFGAMFLSMLISTVVLANINSFAQSLVNGIIMLFALIIAVYIGIRGQRSASGSLKAQTGRK
jgi:ribose transport system permease protein